MKLIDPQSTNEQAVWSNHLKSLFKTLDINEELMTNHIAESLALYCRTFHPSGIASSNLHLLMARSFCALGNEGAARKVILSMPTHRNHVDRWLEILKELNHFPDLLPYFTAGIIRPADWAGAQTDRMWTLDFGLLCLKQSEKHEILLYGTIKTLIHLMACFWDATEGEGILGVRNLAALNVECKKRSKRTQSLTSVDVLIRYIEEIFSKLATSRPSWKHAPNVLNLNIA